MELASSSHASPVDDVFMPLHTELGLCHFPRLITPVQSIAISRMIAHSKLIIFIYPNSFVCFIIPFPTNTTWMHHYFIDSNCLVLNNKRTSFFEKVCVSFECP